jgi:hypothetical protein
MRQPISAHYCGYSVITSIEADAARAVPRIRQPRTSIRADARTSLGRRAIEPIGRLK